MSTLRAQAHNPYVHARAIRFGLVVTPPGVEHMWYKRRPVQGAASERREESLEEALAHPAGRGVLVARLLPVVHARIARRLMRRRGGSALEDLRSLVEDMSQDVFEQLFRHDARALRKWDPARGMKLENYVGMIAEQHVDATLRTQRRSPFTEEPSCAQQLDDALPSAAAPDRQIVARELLERVRAEVAEDLSPKGCEIFERLILKEQSVAAVADELGMSVASIHAWSSRLKRRLREVFTMLDADAGGEGTP
jgi:RNA polymerase sigma-70 factor (ECF subfamily)